MNKPDFFTAWTEPESSANTTHRPVYPYNHVTSTRSGHTFELDDTPTRERIRLNHRSGTFIEMHPNGDEVHKVYGDGYEIIIKDKNMLVKGKLNITVEGDAVVNIMGDLLEQIDGNVERHIKGNFTQVVDGVTSMVSQGDTKIACGGALGGGLKLSTGDYMHLEGDLSIDGEVTATKITSYGRVDAGTGMMAGPYGFVTPLGGVSAGLPIAVPGTVNASLSVNAPLVTAGLGQFGVSSSILGFDVVNLLLHNFHIHPTPKGPSGPPIPKETGA